MAQIKRRKVTNKAGQNGTRSFKLKKNKKFWIILISTILGLVAVGVVIGVVYYINNKDSDSDREVLDYFDGESEELDIKVREDLRKNSLTNTYPEDYTPNFTKLGYDGFKMHLNTNDTQDDNTYVEYMFIFACDLSTYYPDEHIDDDIDTDEESLWYNKDHYESYKALSYFQYMIDVENERLAKAAVEEDGEGALPAYDIALYIIDTSSSTNKIIFDDAIFGGSDDSDESTSTSTMFALVKNGKLESKYKKDNDLFVKDDHSAIASTAINNAVNYMQAGFKK